MQINSVYPNYSLRVFRNGQGKCENRWINENILAQGATVEFQSAFVDENLETLSKWIERHNSYTSREAVDLLNLEYGFLEQDSMAVVQGSRTSIRRWLIEKVYFRLPGGLRAFFYYIYRYFFRLGFLDGATGMTYHFLQGFWYRYLVDVKVLEVKSYMDDYQCNVEVAIDKVLGIKVWNLRNTSGDI